MGVETSNKKTEPLDQSNRVIAKGKRKGESNGQALSLQDVFSDSANLAGRQQKTSRLSEIGQAILVATPKKEMKKQSRNTRTGGRKKLPAIELKTKKLQMHVTALEYTRIQTLYHASGKKTVSDFMRVLILDKNKSNSIINKVELIKHLDVIGNEIGRIGNNINQLAKYANIQIKSGKVDPKTMIRFTDQMDSYLQERRELAKAYRALVRNE
jgi:hypothetical protein